MTTPEALNKAMEAGLIHHGREGRDSETGESTEVEVVDSRATRFIRQIEAKDELDRLIIFIVLSSGERLVLQGIRQGLMGKQLERWVTAKDLSIAPNSVPVLASRVKSKLRATTKT